MSPNEPRPGLLTIQQYIVRQQRSSAEATGEFSFLLSGITIATKFLADKVRRSGLPDADILGATGEVNVQGEQVQKLDEIANQMLINCIGYRRNVRALASEEVENPLELETGDAGKYFVLFDPLDGSSNIDVNIPVGTIFSVLRRPDDAAACKNGICEEILQAGCQQVAAGYVLYGSATVMVYTTGDGVHQFVLDPSIGAFILVAERLRIPERKAIYSCNEANAHSFPEGVRNYLDWVKTAEAGPYSARYVGSFVADFHRTLLKGGVFLYPATAKSPKGKLRLMYEANPMAFLVEQAGGSASSGNQRILDIPPTELHQRTPLIIGSKHEVDLVCEFLSGKRGAVEV
jgi:fructose-1,6-bisphosphatase I